MKENNPTPEIIVWKRSRVTRWFEGLSLLATGLLAFLGLLWLLDPDFTLALFHLLRLAHPDFTPIQEWRHPTLMWIAGLGLAFGGALVFLAFFLVAGVKDRERMISKRSVLIVADRSDDAELIQAAFRKANFDNPLRTASDAEEALSYLDGKGVYADRERFPLPHLILLDRNWPGDGAKILQWVRSRRWPENFATFFAPPAQYFWRLHVVVLTEPNGFEELHEMFEAEGISGFLYDKPNDFAKLVSTVKRIGDFWLRRV
jgi:CheY-like chemotaxis protein